MTNELDPTQEPYRSRLLAIAETIDSPCYEGHFDMSYWIRGARENSDGALVIKKSILKKLEEQESLHTCGTAACIGGTMEMVMRRDGLITDPVSGAEYGTAWSEVKFYFGLNSHTAEQLFFPDGLDRRGNYLIDMKSGHRAARVVRHLAKTGEVDWEKADEK